MAWQDDIAQKRRESVATQAARKEAKQLHDENITAVKNSGKGFVSAATGLAKTEDIDTLIRQVKEVQLAALIGSSKPQVILTDQTDLGERFTKLGDLIAQTIKGLDSTESDDRELRVLKELQVQLKSSVASIDKGNKASEGAFLRIQKAIENIQVAPVVNVPAPNVKVDVPKLDLSSITETLQAYIPVKEEKIDLECYRAQDITEVDGRQYVGFVNAEGAWYIIENDMAANSLRYVFGASGYAKAFNKASGYEYRLLNEAINAL